MLFKLQHEDFNEEGEKTVGDTLFHRNRFLHGYGSIPWNTSQLDHGQEDKTAIGENGQRQRDLRPPCLSITASRYSSAYRRRPAGKGSNSPIYSQAMASEYKFSTAMWAQPD
ncbi:hypothetical protein V1478_016619 [Vespula squamosa]|uniref:Uncharacterized protein n=1 Tax=Vespula squamosa TaxID=30214 RepID=A0ABD2A0A4_VESSQ